MPRNIETYSQCASLGTAHFHKQIGGLIGVIIDVWLFSPVVTVAGLTGYIAWLLLAAAPIAYCATAIAILIGLTAIKDWYYNERLLCLRDRDCVVGTVMAEPDAAFDGDRKLNLMLAPFTRLEIEDTLIEHLGNNREMLAVDGNFDQNAYPDSPPAMPEKGDMEAD
jgi:hypothetical protein